MSFDTEDQEFILCRVKIDPVTQCWEYQGGRERTGYGRVRRKGKPRKAHRLAYQAFVGPLIEGMFVCHHCDNPCCVNPDHLFQGTPKQNAQDRARKKRNRDARGTNNGRAKLTESDIPEIRRRLSSGESQQSIGDDYGVSQRAISLIKLGRHWKHVK